MHPPKSIAVAVTFDASTIVAAAAARALARRLQLGLVTTTGLDELARASLSPDVRFAVVGRGMSFDVSRWVGGPILVAGMATELRTIVAASDCRNRQMPVLRVAAELSRQLEAQLVAVHNFGGADSQRFPATVAGVIASHRRLRLAGVSGVDDTIITDDASSARAVLRCASSIDADLIVVGARRDRSKTVARIVVEKTVDRSVLVVPFD